MIFFLFCFCCCFWVLVLVSLVSGLTCVYSMEPSLLSYSECPLNAMYGFGCLFYNRLNLIRVMVTCCMVLFELNVITFARICVMILKGKLEYIVLQWYSNTFSAGNNSDCS